MEVKYDVKTTLCSFCELDLNYSFEVKVSPTNLHFRSIDQVCWHPFCRKVWNCVLLLSPIAVIPCNLCNLWAPKIASKLWLCCYLPYPPANVHMSPSQCAHVCLIAVNLNFYLIFRTFLPCALADIITIASFTGRNQQIKAKFSSFPFNYSLMFFHIQFLSWKQPMASVYSFVWKSLCFVML